MSEIHQLTEASEHYPPLLRELARPPEKLFVRGNLELLSQEPLVAVVGSRKATPYGKQCVERLFEPVVAAGVPLVSGLAYGIDALAHQTCLQQERPTIAVLGSGLDDESIYPRRHISLAHQIIAGGGTVISEYSPGTPAYPGQFPERNRIVAGLVALVVIIQAAKRSGSLITARLALEANREVGAVPGPIVDRMSQGTNKLITEGAHPICSSEDIFNLLGLEVAVLTQTSVADLTSQQKQMIQALSSAPIHVDQIVSTLSWSTATVTSVLIELELLGVVENVGGMKYISKIA